jgi:hypothetical protein
MAGGFYWGAVIPCELLLNTIIKSIIGDADQLVRKVDFPAMQGGLLFRVRAIDIFNSIVISLFIFFANIGVLVSLSEPFLVI